MSGTVEVDETFVGGIKHGGKRGRGTDKPVVVIAVEILKPKGFGRIRMRHIPDAAGNRLVLFLRLLEQAVVTKPITEAKITYSYEW